MSLRALWVWLASWVVGPQQHSGEEGLQIARHRQLAMAVPFPQLDWNRDTESLRILHDYAVALANSVIDWYVRKRHWKRFWSIILRFLIFLFAIFGILIPLLRVLCPDWVSDLVRAVCPQLTGDLAGFAAEAALVFIGIAAGLNLIDRLVGFSSGWMRYMSAAMRAHKALLEFELKWNCWARDAARKVASSEVQPAAKPPPPAEAGVALASPGTGDVTPADDPAAPSRPDRSKPETDPILAVWALCDVLLAIVDQETNEWSIEFKNSISHLNDHFTGLGRPGGRMPS
ncbi:MAG: SLATT domain-containing protein [Xanthobacteraceae bacterium]|jgi:hypothetical protein